MPLAQLGRIRYIEQSNQGQAVARNLGISEAKGDYIALLDDDDLWPPDKLEWQVAYLQEHSDVDGIVGDVVWIEKDKSLVPLPPIAASLLHFEMFFEGSNILSPGQILIRRTALLAVGGYSMVIFGDRRFRPLA